MPSRRPRATHADQTAAESSPPGAESPTRRVSDPRAIRALAHPARLAVLDVLAAGESLTATECAAATGLSPSATAYHLTLLARYGFAERAAARVDGRDRPWRATGRPPSVDIDVSTPGGAAAAAAVGLAQLDRTRTLAERWAVTAHLDSGDWQNTAALTNTDLWLTADEARQLADELDATIARHRHPTVKKGQARRVRVMNLIVPHQPDAPAAQNPA